VEEHLAALRRRHHEEIGDRRLVEPEAGRVCQHELLDPVRRDRGDLGGDHPTHRVADEAHPVEPGRVEPVEVVEAHLEALSICSSPVDLP
jgi:hypothetical protein